MPQHPDKEIRSLLGVWDTTNMAEDDGHESNGTAARVVHLPIYRDVVPPVGRRPTVRGDCLPGGFNVARPCRWTACRYNMSGAPEGKPSCVLDVADEGPVTLEEVGEMMGVTRERVRQIEAGALRKIKRRDHITYNGMLRLLMENN